MFPLFTYEKELLSKGIKYVAGVDEVGRGPLAGPMVVCAVVLNLEEISDLERDFKLDNKTLDTSRNNDIKLYKKINDSKKLTAKSRELLEIFIKCKALSYNIIQISNQEIDSLGISEVTQRSFYNAVTTLSIKPDYIITDNFPIKKIIQEAQKNLPKGDSKSISVAAASIIGKVYRDTLMEQEHKKYPNYRFDKHKGYGTKEHFEAIKKYGPCEIHRRSFEPLKTWFPILLSNYR